MLDMFGEIGLFGDSLMPMVKEENKPVKKETKEKAKKENTKKAKTTKFKCPLSVVFDSTDKVDLDGDGEYTKEELLLKILELKGLGTLKEVIDKLELTKLSESIYLCRPKSFTRCDKGYEGKYLLLDDLKELEGYIEISDESTIGSEEVKSFVEEQLGIKVNIYLIKDVYFPIPDCKQYEIPNKMSLPVNIKALTLYGEQLEVSLEDYLAFVPKKDEQLSLIEDEDDDEKVVEIKKDIMDQILKTLLPEYSYDLEIRWDEKCNTLIVFHKNNEITSKPAAVKEEELYPTDAEVSLIFTKINLNAEMFAGKKEITKKELLKYIARQYPEYSPERTELIYDKKKKLIIPSFKSGKRGSYQLEDTASYRYESTPIMSIKAYREAPDHNGCVNGSVEFHLPKIPFEVLSEIVEMFLRIYRRNKTEAIAMIFYNIKNCDYEIYIPMQRAEEGYVEFDRDTSLELDESKYLVMEIHSHGRYRAYWSSTDNEDELAHRLYAVVGSLDTFRYDNEHLIVRAATGGLHVKLDAKEVFSFKRND